MQSSPTRTYILTVLVTWLNDIYQDLQKIDHEPPRRSLNKGVKLPGKYIHNKLANLQARGSLGY